MTFLEAAQSVLAEADAPLHFREIARRALAQGKITTTGATPDVTMASRLYTVTKQSGSDFERLGKGVFGLAHKEPGGIHELIAEFNARTRSRLHALLALVHAKRFEALVMELLLQMGFEEKTLEVTQYVKDGGIDVLGTYTAAALAPVYAAVQVKRWKSNVQSPTVTSLRGSLQVHQYGIIMTTSDFSRSARLEAEAPGKARISLINGDQLVELMIKHGVGVTSEKQLVTQLDEEWWEEVLDTPDTPALVTASTRPIAPAPAQSDTVEDAVTPRPARGGTRPGTAASSKPSAVTILGETIVVRTWKGVLVAVAEEMARRHPADFASTATAVHGKKRHYVAQVPDAMIAPAPIGGTGLWIEANQSAVSVNALCAQLLQAFGHSADDFQVHLG